MPTWKDLSRDSLEAAKKLAVDGHLRSSVSRSYYAVYAAATSVFAAQGVRFAHGRRNPGHDQLIFLIGYNLKQPRDVQQRIRKLMRILREARETADYRPGRGVDRRLTLFCIRGATVVLQELGISDETSE